MKKTCPSCNSKFECNNTDIVNCVCYTVNLNNDALTNIKKTFSDCLCFNCLRNYNPNPDCDKVTKTKK